MIVPKMGGLLAYLLLHTSKLCTFVQSWKPSLHAGKSPVSVLVCALISHKSPASILAWSFTGRLHVWLHWSKSASILSTNLAFKTDVNFHHHKVQLEDRTAIIILYDIYWHVFPWVSYWMYIICIKYDIIITVTSKSRFVLIQPFMVIARLGHTTL